MRTSLFRNKKGITPTVSAIMMVAVTVVSMLLVVSFSQTIIEARRNQMGENLFVENVSFNATSIKVYVTNNGHGVLTLEKADVNGKLYDLAEGKVTLQATQGQSVTIEDYTVDPIGIYQISFISLNNKDLGSTEVTYS